VPTPRPAGLEYLITHGHAADGSSGENTERAQHLVNPREHNPVHNDVVARWIRRRAVEDAPMQQAAARASS